MAKKPRRPRTANNAASNRQAQVEEASLIAAIHWYALVIEKGALELVITSPSRFEKVKTILSEAVDQLNSAQPEPQPKGGESGGSCPPGWELCEGVCQPECPPGEGRTGGN
jgi:hypothetical protein